MTENQLIIQDKIETIVRETLAIADRNAVPTGLYNRLELDSMSFMTIVLRIENEFGFEFGEEQLIIDNFQSVRSLVNYVEEKCKAAT